MKRTAKGYKLTHIIKGQWTPDEDRMLLMLIEKIGERKWSKIGLYMPGRLGKQCRERWINHLQPDIKKDVWSEEEEAILIENHKKIGNRWATIARKLPGRTDNTVKNHWNASKRKYSYHKLRQTKFISKKPKSSILNNYIKTVLSLPPPLPPQITYPDPTTHLDFAWGNNNNYFNDTNNESYYYDHVFGNSDSMFGAPIDPIFGGSQQPLGRQTGYVVNDLSSNPLPEMNDLTLNDDFGGTMSSLSSQNGDMDIWEMLARCGR